MKLEINLFLKFIQQLHTKIYCGFIFVLNYKLNSNCEKRWKRKVDVCLFSLFVVVYGLVVLKLLCL